MQKALRLLATATISGLAAFAVAVSPACSGPKDGGTSDAGDAGSSTACTGDYTTCTCTTKADCPKTASLKNFICSAAKTCIPICTTAADCSSLGTGWVCEDAICRPPGCGGDADCQSGQQCIGGTCTTRVGPTQVASCAVEPSAATVAAGSAKTFTLIAKDSSGAVLPYKATMGEVTWTTNIGTTSMDTGASVLVTAGATAGAGSVKATVGSTACTDASVTNVGAPPADKLRVVVVNALDQSVITDATVRVGGDAAEATTLTAANGTNEYDFDVPAAATTVEAFKKDFSYVTYLGVTSHDVVVFLKPIVMPGKATGDMTPDSFKGLSDVRGTVHLAINGPSIAGNLIDISLTTLLGESVPTHIDLGGSTQTDINLPDGIVIGLGSQMFKDKFSVQSDPGLRNVWSLGGNVVLSDVLGVVSSATGGGSIDVGSILSALLPVVGKLESGAIVAKQFTAGDSGTLDLKLTNLLRLQTVAVIPQFKQYTLGGVSQQYDGAIVLGGVLQSPQGLSPLGLTAGVDKHTGSSTSDMTPDGIIDPIGMGGTPGELPLRIAPLHSGFEGGKYTTLALGANLSGLLGGITGGDSGSTSKDGLMLSGRVVFPGDILFKNNGQAANKIQIPEFMYPADINVDEGARSVNAAAVMGADLYRLDLTADTSGGEWQVYYPPSMAGTDIALPKPPEGFEDRFAADGTSGKLPTTTLQSVSLKGKTGVTYDSVVAFDSDNADDLTSSIDAFNAHGINRSATPTP